MVSALAVNAALMSHPPRVGGLKIDLQLQPLHLRRPTPHGVGGLKRRSIQYGLYRSGPTPHGVGGLKIYFVRLLDAGLRPTPPTGWVD